MIFLLFMPYLASALQKLTILGTNDLHGRLFAYNITTSKNELIKQGGLSLFSSYLSILRDTEPNLIWLDGGDLYTGTLESQFFNGSSISEALNYLNPDAAVTGNHDFDFSVRVYLDRLNQQKFPTLLANMQPKMEKTHPYKIFQVAENVSLGVIGLVTPETPQTTSANLKDYQFEDLKKVTEETVKNLRQQGVDVIILTLHVGMFCNQKNDENIYENKNRTHHDPSAQKILCDPRNELFTFVSSLQSNLVDGIVSGHTHSIVHHYINGIPIIQGQMGYEYFNLIHVTYDETVKKVTDTYIEGPVAVCDKQLNGTCNAGQEGAWQPTLFRGKKIEEDPKFIEHFVWYIRQVDKIKDEQIAFISQEMKRSPEDKNEMGIFFCDVMMNVSKAEFCFLNPGAIRINFPQGDLNYDLIFQALPFSDTIATTIFTGEELMKVFKVLYESQMSLYIQKGFQITIEKNGYIKKLIKATLGNGQEIDLKKEYTVAINDFFLRGGDDFRQIREWYTPKNLTEYAEIRSSIKAQAQAMKQLNTPENPIFDPKNPQFIIIEKKTSNFLQE